MTVFRNATVLEFDPPRIREGLNVVVEGGEITEVGPHAGESVGSGSRRGGSGSGGGAKASRNGSSIKIIEMKGKLLFPGLVNGHTHYYSALARGVMADLNPMPDFVSILRQLWWRLDQAIDLDILYYSGLTGSLDAIRCGTTAAIDHNASANAIEGSLVALKRGFETAGLRGATCYEVTDRYGAAGMQAGIEENVAFADLVDSERKERRERAERGDGRDVLVESHIGGHAPCTIPDEGLARIADACEKTGRGFHVHVAEDRWDVSHSHITYAEDLISRLDRFGLVNDRSMLIHGVFLTPAEVELINSRNAFMVHNCRSNMNNGVGYNHLLPEIGNLALGTDGIGGNMFSSMQTAFFKHRDAQGPVQADFFLKALAAGNRLLERVFHRPFGRVEPGYPADLVVAEYHPPTPLLPENIAGHMAFGMGSEIVESVMIAGKMVMEERRFPLDLEGIYGEAREQATRLWERMNGVTP
jgi:putative selenium metabolism protein SsnA